MRVAEQLLCDGWSVKAVVDLRFGSFFPRNDVANYEYPELGVAGSELSDSRKSTDFGAGKWISGEPSQS
ncbi:hypothetical protein M8C21_033781 [Ambrosia artemisiifolia]|uniref:Uncharacterized protein n=1 Tax=Ambrosia artemisiifolia TaxID=4212 RepID=A0AAD5BSQ7_AMBAR|nr:hypothetical protein M8C21_033781 [Ambrosia artemisiifolia]